MGHMAIHGSQKGVRGVKGMEPSIFRYFPQPFSLLFLPLFSVFPKHKSLNLLSPFFQLLPNSSKFLFFFSFTCMQLTTEKRRKQKKVRQKKGLLYFVDDLPIFWKYRLVRGDILKTIPLPCIDLVPVNTCLYRPIWTEIWWYFEPWMSGVVKV